LSSISFNILLNVASTVVDDLQYISLKPRM
jgi:hypothetical protein